MKHLCVLKSIFYHQNIGLIEMWKSQRLSYREGCTRFHGNPFSNFRERVAKVYLLALCWELLKWYFTVFISRFAFWAAPSTDGNHELWFKPRTKWANEMCSSGKSKCSRGQKRSFLLSFSCFCLDVFGSEGFYTILLNVPVISKYNPCLHIPLLSTS